MLTCQVRDLIRIKYASPQWVLIEEIRNKAGFDATRSADAIAMNVWPSKGLSIVGFEIKIDRWDWKHELNQPEKSNAIKRYCDAWWLVAPEGVARPEEIPADWGWYLATEEGLEIKKPCVELRPQEIGRSFLAAVIKKLGANYVPLVDVQERAKTIAQDILKEREEQKIIDAVILSS